MNYKSDFFYGVGNSSRVPAAPTLHVFSRPLSLFSCKARFVCRAASYFLSNSENDSASDFSPAISESQDLCAGCFTLNDNERKARPPGARPPSHQFSSHSHVQAFRAVWFLKDESD